MARLQEESLRQDYASTSTSATAGRRSSSFSLHSLRRCELDLEEEEEEDEGYDQLPPPQPRLFRTGSMQRGSMSHSHTFSSFRDCRRTSAGPQFSLSGLSQLSGPSSLITDTHLRRSMPNLIRAPSMPSVPSIPCLASPFFHNSSLSCVFPTVFLVPSPGQLTQRVQSIGNFSSTPRQQLKATAYVSPTVQQGPTSTSLSTSIGVNQSAAPRSSLPRPASLVGASGLPRASKIMQPTRSLLAPPKSLAALSALRDGSWKDGCY
uniref:SLAIN motif family, member 1a n=1 Tax=Xiphophorus couchianus TaxID=32473 RepID=A0A3B5MKV9_9TELE